MWEAATARTATGWETEIRIPLKSLLFRTGLDTWGFNIERRIQRLQETDRWSSPTPRLQSDAAEPGRRPRRLAPVRSRARAERAARAHRRRRRATAPGLRFATESHPSLDVTQRLGANTLASLTVNTDFAETEVDARQVNLTRFPLFFPEKRTFFLEGADIFDDLDSVSRPTATSSRSSAAASDCWPASRSRSMRV